MVHDRLLDAERTKQFKTLILPNIAALSAAQCDQLRGVREKWREHHRNLRDQPLRRIWSRRKDFGLSDLLGVKWSGRMEGPMQNSYLTLEHQTAPHHPLLKGLEDASAALSMAPLGWSWKRTKGFGQMPVTLIPSYPDLPMEKVYPRQAKTDIAACLFERNWGLVASSTFPWDIDRTYWEVLGRRPLQTSSQFCELGDE
jgi:hypothetical protein